MSRVAKKPVVLPKGVEVKIDGGKVTIKGSLGTLSHDFGSVVEIVQKEDELLCNPREGQENSHAMSGTARALVNNMVQGVSQGFEKKLTLVGVGYRAQAQGSKLNLSLGFSHPVEYMLPEGIKVETPSQTEVVIKGINKQQVGQVAAEIRAFRSPEPYKGKGVRYANEVVILKETKKK